MIGLTIIDNDNVYIATASNGYTLDTCCYKNGNMPVWEETSSPHTLLAYLGDERPLDAVRYGKSLLKLKDEKLTTTHIIQQVLHNAIDNLKTNKVIDEGETIDKIWGPMFIAKDDRVFKMDPYGNAMQIQNFEALGDGYERAKSVLYMTSDIKDIKYRILKAMALTMQLSGTGHYPIVIRNTQDPSKVENYSIMDTMLYIHNFEEANK